MPVEPCREGSIDAPRKSASAFRTISEVAKELDIPAHVLRFWESKFAQVKPLKRGGGRRYYRPEDIALLRGIRELLYVDGYTIRGVQKLIREGGVKAIASRKLSSPQNLALSVPSPHKEQTTSSQSQSKKQIEMCDTNRKELALVLKELELFRDKLKKTLV